MSKFTESELKDFKDKEVYKISSEQIRGVNAGSVRVWYEYSLSALEKAIKRFYKVGMFEVEAFDKGGNKVGAVWFDEHGWDWFLLGVRQ